MNNVVQLRATLTKGQRLEEIKRSHEASDEQAIATGQLIQSFKADYPGSWLEDVRKHCGIGRARAYDYIAFAKGKKTVAEHKAAKAVAQKKFYDSRESTSGGRDDDDGTDDPATIWSRGLLARAEIAEGDAAYEDWSKFKGKVKPQHIEAAKRAAAAWLKLAAYLESIK
jgi:hypothetical protein